MNQVIKSKYCPNIIIEDGNISLGEFKTLQDANEFPLQGIWCVNRENDNKFNAYKSQGTRIFVICSWGRHDSDSLKYVLALIHTNGKIHYWDMNDLPLYPEAKKNQYEGSLGDSITCELYRIANSMNQGAKDKLKTESNNTKIQYNMNQVIRLTEGDLHRIVRQCVNEALNEIGDTERGQYALGSVCARNHKKYRDCYNNYDPNASKYYKTMNDASDIAHNSRLAADGDIEQARRMVNAYAKGSRNYMSSMNGSGNGDYRNMKIKH